MKFKNCVAVLVVAFVMAFAGAVIADAEYMPEIYTFGSESYSDTKINTQTIGGESVIVMPSSQSPDKVRLYGNFTTNVVVKGDKGEKIFRSGDEINLNDLCTGEDYRIKFVYKTGGQTKEYDLRILFSENISSIYIISDNPAEKGREWVEEAVDKSNKATGRISVIRPDGTRVYGGNLTQIKGRGNSTWGFPKKPYQIKISEKYDLLESGNDSNKSSTWVLLANYADPSLIHNVLALNMGRELGMNTNIENKFADLYYDGEYRGNYLLSEKVEVGKGRVNIENSDDKNEEANDGADFDEFEIKEAVTENGATYVYCEGMASPEDITGGYLLEMDYAERAVEEISYFRTSRGQYVVVKSPEYSSKEQMDYIATFYQEYEDAVYNGGVNPDTGKLYSDYTDRDSIAVYYLINELSKSRDMFGSSAYLYKNEGEDKMYMGPLWDYDLSFGKSRLEEADGEHSYGISTYNTEFGMKLIEIDDFYEEVKGKFNALYPLINSDSGDGVNIDKSSAINSLMWYGNENSFIEVEKTMNFIKKRAEFLKNLFESDAMKESPDDKIYNDVFIGDWFYESVKNVTDKGYMNGTGNGFFDPYAKVKRSEASQIIYNLAERPAVEFESAFTDVWENDWYAPCAVWSQKNGITNSFDGAFRPFDYVTRKEFVTYLYRYYGSPETGDDALISFADTKESYGEVRNALSWAVEQGILSGDGNGNLMPDGFITRAEICEIIK